MPSWRRIGVSARLGSPSVQIDWNWKVKQASTNEADLTVLYAYWKEGDSWQLESEPNIQLENERYRNGKQT